MSAANHLSAVGSGRTLEEAVADALAKLGAAPEQVTLRKIEEGSAGITGQGYRPFRVRATWKAEFAPPPPPPPAPRHEAAHGDERTAFRSMDTVMAPAVRPERSERSERSDRGDRPERRERGARGGRDRDRGERRERPDRGGERGDRGDRGERGERGERPPRRYSPTSPEERFNVDEAFMANVREQAGWLMKSMGMDATVEVTGEADEVLVAINSDTDDALLTGRRGDTRMAIQTVLARLVNPKRGPGAHLIVDVNGYWQRRRDSLLERARELAERAVAGGEEMTTEPMSSEERRIVHRALAEDGRVTTESYGEGALKRIAIRAVEASDAEA